MTALLISLNNPTGYMPGRDEGAALRDEMIKTADAAAGKIVLLFDDAYEGYVYEESAAPVSLFGHFIGAHPNIVPVKCDGATKEFLLYGARIAAVTFGFHPEWGDPELLNNELDSKVGALIRGTISNSNLAFQHAVAGAIGEGAECDREREIVRKILAARYVEFKKALSDMLPGTAAPDPFNAGFFCFVNLERPAEEFADMLLKSRRVGVIPLVDRNLGINGIRIAFCSVEQSMIRETVSRISSALAEKA